MDIRITTQALEEIATDALIVSAFRQKGEAGSHYVAFSDTTAKINTLLHDILNDICVSGEFRGKLGELLTLHPVGKLATKRIIVVGLGLQEKLNVHSIRQASAIAARHAQQTGAHKIVLAVHGKSGQYNTSQEIQAQVEGAVLGLYRFSKYQHSAENDKTEGVTHIRLITGNESEDRLSAVVQRGVALAEATNFARDLVNEPPNVLTPTELANRASAMAKQCGLTCEVLGKAQIEALRMGGLLAVAQGSAEPPKFIILRYQGTSQDAQQKGLALVGKGVTFDTGGISIKPAQKMDEMKGDMAGAAAVIGAMQAIAALKPPINVTAFVPTTENMPSGTAFRPGDILRMMNGKTMEIVNTDAEGRLILADALTYAAQEGFSPIVDVATLTGAMVVALGTKITGFFSNNPQLQDHIVAAGESAGEKFWAMPLDEDYAEQIRSDIADIKQSNGREASAITAAKILQQFVGDAQWAHLDIAGTFYEESKKSYQEKGATGVAVRTLAELAQHLAN